MSFAPGTSTSGPRCDPLLAELFEPSPHAADLALFGIRADAPFAGLPAALPESPSSEEANPVKLDQLASNRPDALLIAVLTGLSRPEEKALLGGRPADVPRAEDGRGLADREACSLGAGLKSRREVEVVAEAPGALLGCLRFRGRGRSESPAADISCVF